MPERIITSVNVIYEDDYDIIGLDNIVNKYIDHQIQKKIENLKLKLGKTKPGSEMEASILKNISYQQETKQRYLEESKDLLSLYREISMKNSPSYFGDTSFRERSSVKKKKLGIISSYLSIATKYMPITISKKMAPEDRCSNCQNKLSKGHGSEYCAKCHLDQEDQMVVTRNKAKEAGYQSETERRLNFIRFLERRQGKNIIEIPSLVFEKLDEYFRSIRFTSREEILKLPYDIYGGKEGTSKQLMYLALSKTSLTEYNENIETICHEYWGWKYSDYSDIFDSIIEDYDSIREAALKLKKEDESGERKVSLSNQFLLLWILTRHSFLVRREDFKIAETQDIIERYSILKRDIEYTLGWPRVLLD
jgi:hypothetical protein